VRAASEDANRIFSVVFKWPNGSAPFDRDDRELLEGWAEDEEDRKVIEIGDEAPEAERSGLGDLVARRLWKHKGGVGPQGHQLPVSVEFSGGTLTFSVGEKSRLRSGVASHSISIG